MAYEYAPSAADLEKVARANPSGRQPVVFVHGLWLLDSSWSHWVPFFEEAGYTAVAPTWPADPPTLELAREAPRVFPPKNIGDTPAYQPPIADKLDRNPATIPPPLAALPLHTLPG